jgi:sarcosine oxidase subunit alpha
MARTKHDDPNTIAVTLDGQTMRVREGVSLAAALLDAGVRSFRRSVSSESRAPLCGMGICHECRVTIDGVPHRRACLVPVAAGMDVRTGGAA